jgi:hypothetical protein
MVYNTEIRSEIACDAVPQKEQIIRHFVVDLG